MAELPVEMRGTLYDLATKSARQVFFAGVAYRSDVGVGGGPVIPPGGGGQPPLEIWGPTDPRPTNPISGIPGLPGYNPPPDISVPPPEGVKPPPPEGGWGYSPEYGWGYFPPGQGGKPQPPG